MKRPRISLKGQRKQRAKVCAWEISVTVLTGSNTLGGLSPAVNELKEKLKTAAAGEPAGGPPAPPPPAGGPPPPPPPPPSGEIM